MFSIKGILTTVGTLFQTQSGAGGASQTPDKSRLPGTIPLNPAGNESAIRSMLERMKSASIIETGRSAQTTTATGQQQEAGELSVADVRTVMGANRWTVPPPKIAKNTPPEVAKAKFALYQIRQAEKDAKLADYTAKLNDTMREFRIDTPAKRAAFLATVAEETAGLTLMTEGKSNWKSSVSVYKGRGIVQLTGESNYLAASQYLKLGEPTTKPPYKLLVEKPELAAREDISFKIAGWFWSENGAEGSRPNDMLGTTPSLDMVDFRQASGLVNSGKRHGRVNHYGERAACYARALESQGVKRDNEEYKELFKNIDAAVKTYQGKNHQLPPDPVKKK